MSGRTAASAGTAALFLVFALGAIAWQGFHASVPAAGAPAAALEFEVPPGATFPEVCDTLEARGLLRQRLFFRLAAKLTGADREIRAGWFSVPGGISGAALLDRLVDGPNVVNRVTIPEGLWRSETAAILASRLDLDEGEVLRLTEDRDFIARLGLSAPTLEGFLFPETYNFPRGATAEAVLTHMVRSFQAYFDAKKEERTAELGMTTLELVTLASIVEAEAVLDEERPRISAVFHNRLELGWKLQADPTVQYARGNRKKLYKRHLDIDSPYNTYKVEGLPPGPICSPGRASIEAALYPAEGSRDLFFVAAGQGGRHIFSRSDREHNRARRRVKSQGKSP